MSGGSFRAGRPAPSAGGGRDWLQAGASTIDES
jgi:hypothetical protein